MPVLGTLKIIFNGQTIQRTEVSKFQVIFGKQHTEPIV